MSFGPGSNKGIKNIKNRLTEEQVLAIFDDRDTTQDRLADKYRVSQSTISLIQRGLMWGWLTSRAR